jgi:hypothetical protein
MDGHHEDCRVHIDGHRSCECTDCLGRHGVRFLTQVAS